MAHLGGFRSHAIEGAARGFEEFLLDAKEFPPESNCLADFVAEWLYRGGVEDCSGSYELFLIVFPLIIDKWLRDPSILDYRGDDETPAFDRRVTAIFDKDEHGDRFYDVLDPYSFEAMKTDPGRMHYSQRPFPSAD